MSLKFLVISVVSFCLWFSSTLLFNIKQKLCAVEFSNLYSCWLHPCGAIYCIPSLYYCKPVVTCRGLRYWVCVCMCVHCLVWDGLFGLKTMLQVQSQSLNTLWFQNVCALKYSMIHSHKHASFHCISWLNCPLPTSSSLSLYQSCHRTSVLHCLW